MRFYTAGSERLRIGARNIAIGTVLRLIMQNGSGYTPKCKWHESGEADSSIQT